MHIMDKDVLQLIKRALREDTGRGDVTSRFLFDENFPVRAVLTAKQDGVICGVEIFKAVFLCLSKDFKFRFMVKDGDAVAANTLIAEFRGPVREMLAGERTALNFLQRFSGIATLANQFVQKSGMVEVYDTRKTTPLLRKLEKYAVRTGGGMNHRFGLYDMVLIKDNHIFAFMQKEKINSRSITSLREAKRLRGKAEANSEIPHFVRNRLRNLNGIAAHKTLAMTTENGIAALPAVARNDNRVSAIRQVVKKAKTKAKGRYKIEVEVENFAEAKEGFLAGADIIMFDNADAGELKRFVKFLGKKKNKVVIEWSGNVDLQTFGNIKKLPVDRVSVGALTHSAKALDFSLKIV